MNENNEEIDTGDGTFGIGIPMQRSNGESDVPPETGLYL